MAAVTCYLLHLFTVCAVCCTQSCCITSNARGLANLLYSSTISKPPHYSSSWWCMHWRLNPAGSVYWTSFVCLHTTPRNCFSELTLTLLGQPLRQATGWRQAACQESKDIYTQLQQPGRTNPQLWAHNKAPQFTLLCTHIYKTKQLLPSKLESRGSKNTFLRRGPYHAGAALGRAVAGH